MARHRSMVFTSVFLEKLRWDLRLETWFPIVAGTWRPIYANKPAKEIQNGNSLGPISTNFDREFLPVWWDIRPRPHLTSGPVRFRFWRVATSLFRAHSTFYSFIRVSPIVTPETRARIGEAPHSYTRAYDLTPRSRSLQDRRLGGLFPIQFLWRPCDDVGEGKASPLLSLP